MAYKSCLLRIQPAYCLSKKKFRKDYVKKIFLSVSLF
nr:MAG TPA: hypothetical protein [Caudoviricetes sp.]